MLCVLCNHSYINEVQTIAQIFFPHARFTFSNDPHAPLNQVDYAVLSRLSDKNTLPAHATGEVFHNGTRIAVCSLNLDNPHGLSEKRLLMLALFKALKQTVDAYTPWGALTGIRPSKMARGWLDEGLDDRQIITMLTDVFFCAENKARLALTVAHAEDRLTERIYAMSAAYLPQKKPLGLYISVPYCASRCLYCSFNSCQKPASVETQARYLKTLLEECRQTAQTTRDLDGVFTSLYIGGGTPTVLTDALLNELLDGVSDCFAALAPHAEYTVEAGRPDSLTATKLKIMKDHGVSRIAVNPQTLNDRTLALIGRNHTAADFYHAFALARNAGFENINADIIAGLPGEGPEDIRRTVEGVLSLSPENVTVHTLAVKRASRLNEYLRDYAFPGALETEAMLDIASEVCAGAGLSPYYLYRQKNMVGLFENVGYSRPGCECLYNVGMMAETQTVLAAGAGGVSKFISGTKIDRVFNVKNPEIYIQRKGANA